jgi:hypothetical protein
MSEIFDLSAFNLNPGESVEVASIVAEKFKTMPQIADMHVVETGIRYDEPIPLVGVLPDSGICQSECKTDSSSPSIVWSLKRWTPKDVGDKLTICPKDYRPILNIARANLTKEGVWNPEGSPEMQIVEDRALNALVSYVHRFAWFGDTAANTVDSGYGVLTNGTNIKLFNCLNGLFQQMFAAVAAEKLERVTIAKNAEATKAAQLALGADDAYNTFKSLVEKADPRLFQFVGNRIISTRSLYMNYYAWLEGKGLSNGVLPLNGSEYSPTSFRGIPIIVNDEWDRIIRQYYDNGTTFDKPHRAVLTSPANIPAGFIENDILTIKSWFSNDDEVAYIKLRNEFDVKLLEEYAAVIAY